MLKQLNRRERTILFVTIIIVMAGISIHFFLIPVNEKNAALDQQIATTDKKMKKYFSLLQKKDILQNMISVTGFTANLQSSTDPIVNALSDLEGAAKTSGIRIIDIRPKSSLTPQRNSKTSQIGIELRAEGDMSAFIQFIYVLENSASLFDVKKFQLSQRSGGASLEASVSILKTTVPD